MTHIRSFLRRPRGLLVPLLVGLVVLGAALILKSGKSGATHSPAVAGHANAIAIKSFSFTPAKLTVTAGTKITFSNGDSTEHTATGDAGGGFDTGTVAQGRSDAVVFSKPGVYPYHCAFHAFMTGAITVK